MKYTLIVPSSYETALTGFAMGATKTVGKTEWRVEIYVGEDYPRIYRAGELQKILHVPELIARMANAVCKQYAQFVALKAD